MPSWVRVETKFISHPKVLDVGPLGEALWLRGLCYAGEQLTDGFVPVAFVRRMPDIKGLAVAAKLVEAGLWEAVDGGFQIHDYLEWQRSRDEANDISSKRAEAGRRGGKQKASNLLAKSQQTASTMPASNASKTVADKNREDIDRNLGVPVSPKPPKPRLIKTPVPDDLAALIPPKVWADIGAEQGLTDEQLRFETGLMIDHFRKKAERYADWIAAWRSWMRSSYRQSKPQNGHAPPNGDGPGHRPKYNAQGQRVYTLADLRAEESHDVERDQNAVVETSGRLVAHRDHG